MILGAYVDAHPISKGRLPSRGNFCNNHTHAKNIYAKKPWGLLLWNKFVIQHLWQHTFIQNNGQLYYESCNLYSVMWKTIELMFEG